MVKYVFSQDSIAKDILYALGMDARGVTSFTLTLKPNSLAMVSVERVLMEDDATKLKSILEDYKLEKK